MTTPAECVILDIPDGLRLDLLGLIVEVGRVRIVADRSGLLGGLLGPVGMWMRREIDETPAYKKVEARGEAVPAAAREIEAFGAHPALLLVSVFGSGRPGAPVSRAGGQVARAIRSRATPRMSSRWPPGVAARRTIARSQPGQRSTAPSGPP